MTSRHFLYFALAALPALLAGQAPPATRWDWFRLVGMAIYQGLLAVKAFQTQAPTEPPKTAP